VLPVSLAALRLSCFLLAATPATLLNSIAAHGNTGPTGSSDTGRPVRIRSVSNGQSLSALAGPPLHELFAAPGRWLEDGDAQRVSCL